MRRGKLAYLSVSAVAVLLAGVSIGPHVSADTPPSDFSLQVTPSPLVATVEPGVKTQIVLKVRNGGTGTEQLKIQPRSFSLSEGSNKVTLLDTTPPAITSWISFSQPTFSIAPGQWENETITLNVPKDAGFSYSFALVIGRQNPLKAEGGGRVINGSLAVFTLINVDRPDARTSLQVASFTASKHVYEYLPATFSVRFHNTGNTIAQPYGNVFIQRSRMSEAPLATLAVNKEHGYILPGSERTITASWDDGFPAYQVVQSPDGSTKPKLVWNWANLEKLRIGRYTARLVAVYSQNGHDVPVEGTISFWVIPWKLLLGLLAVILLLLFALFVMFRGVARPFWRRLQKRRTASADTDTKPEDS